MSSDSPATYDSGGRVVVDVPTHTQLADWSRSDDTVRIDGFGKLATG
jgi:hypothetical protein